MGIVAGLSGLIGMQLKHLLPVLCTETDSLHVVGCHCYTVNKFQFVVTNSTALTLRKTDIK